jgi:hypothetical protein
MSEEKFQLTIEVEEKIFQEELKKKKEEKHKKKIFR